jgi:hypothetical protein
MKRTEALWLAFEKFAIFFSFAVAFILVMALLTTVLGAYLALPEIEAVRDNVACPLISDVNGLVVDLKDAVITRTIHISQTIPVQFALALDKNLDVQLTDAVSINRPTNFTLPAGGGQINGTVHLALPKGQKLPVHMKMTVPVDEELPVIMDVPVTIPLKETELGPITARLQGLLRPWLDRFGEMLGCAAPGSAGP